MNTLSSFTPRGARSNAQSIVSKINTRLGLAALACVAVIFPGESALAANAYYNTTNATANWSTATWTMGNNGTHGATAPNSTDAGNIVYFTTTTQNLTLDQNITVGALSVSSQPGGTSVGHGSALTLTASGANAITMDGTGLTTILSGSSLAGTFVAGEASINVNQNNSGTSIRVNPDVIMLNSNLGIGSNLSSGNVTIGGNITNGDSVTRQLNFRGNNTGFVTTSGTIGATLGGGGGITIQNLGTNAAAINLNGGIGAATGVGAAITISNNATGTGALNINGALGESVSAITHNSTTSVTTLSGNNTNFAGTVNVTAGSLSIAKTAAQGNSTITVANGATLALGVGGNGSFTSSGIDSLFAGTTPGVTLGASSRVGIDTTGGNFTYGSSVPAATYGLNKIGSNTLTLTGANAYEGGTTVSVGRLTVGASGTLGADISSNNVAVSPGAFLTVGAATNAGSNQTVTLTSSASSLAVLGLDFNGIPNATIAQADTNGGVLAINAVTGFTADLSTVLGGKNLSVGAIGTSTFTGAAGTIVPGSGSIYRIGGGGGTITFSTTNLFTGANDVVVNSASTNGGGTVVLGAAQNFTGNLTVNGGTLKLGNAGALGDNSTHTAGVVVGGAAIFDLAGISPTYNAPVSMNSTNTSFDVRALTNSGAAATFGGPITFLRATGFGGSGNITLTGAITGGGFQMIKDSTGLLTLQNSGNVILGSFQGNRGTLQVNSGTTLNFTSMEVGTGNSVGAGLTLNGGNVTSAGLTRFGQGSGSASGSLILNSGTLTVPGLTKGSLTFNVNFNGGTLKASGNNASFLASATIARVQAGGALVDDGGFAITIGQALTHNGTTTDGGLAKSGAGTLTLTGNNTFNGTTTVTAGTLIVSGGGRINTSSGISVATGATLTNNSTAAISPALSLTEGSSLGGTGAFNPVAMTLVADLSGGTFSPVALSTSLVKAGALGFTLTNVVDGSYTLFSGTAPTGSFTSVSIGGSPLADQGAGIFSANIGGIDYTFNDGTNLLLVAVPEPGTWVLVGIGLTFLLHRRRRTNGC